MYGTQQGWIADPVKCADTTSMEFVDMRGFACGAGLRALLIASMLVGLLAGSIPGRAQDAGSDSVAVQELRQTIEQSEQDGDYRAMILAAVELRDRGATPEDWIFAQRSLGRGYALLGDFERAVDALSAAVEQVQPGIPQQLLAEIYRDTAGMLGELGRYDQSLSLVERGLDALTGSEVPELEAELLVMKGSVLGALGRLDEAMASIEQAMDRPLATDRQRIMRRNNLGMIHKWRGDLDAALPEFEAVYEQALAADSEQLIVYGLLELGDVERQLGELNTARRHLQEALRRAEAAGEDRWTLFAHMYLAELAAAEGDEGTAELHRETVQRIQTEIQDDTMANRARVLEISLEVMEREQEVERLQLERELQSAQLERGRTLLLLGSAIAGLLVIALWLAIQRNRVRATANRELDRLANTDPLTGLNNRRYFLDHMRRLVVGGAAEGALILIDLDRFKQVNDDHGHDHGDAVLKAVSDRIQSIMRGEDALARWGGEEFLIFLPRCDVEAAERVAERIRCAIHQPPITHDDVQHSITATFGVTAFEPGQGLDDALRWADEAMLHGKRGGRNRIQRSTRAEPDSFSD